MSVAIKVKDPEGREFSSLKEMFNFHRREKSLTITYCAFLRRRRCGYSIADALFTPSPAYLYRPRAGRKKTKKKRTDGAVYECKSFTELLEVFVMYLCWRLCLDADDFDRLAAKCHGDMSAILESLLAKRQRQAQMEKECFDD